MSKYFLITVILSFTVLSWAAESELNQSASKVETEQQEMDLVDPLFSGEPLPEPVFYTPSPVVVWIRANGIHLLYKYFAFQDWVVDKVKRNIFSFKVMRYTP